MPETEHLAPFKKALTAFLILFSAGKISSQIYPDEKVHRMLKTGIEKIIIQDYDQAAEIFLKLDRNYPGIPLGKIYSAAVEITRAYDFGIDFNSDLINSSLKKAADISDELLEKDPDNKWYIYFSALAEGYTAYYNALEENFLSSLAGGFSAMQGFEKCLSADSSFYEAYTAIGVYRYWKSRKTEFISWLPFIKDEREQGIKDILYSLDHFTYNRHLAENSLIWIYIDKKDFKKSSELAEQLVKSYPRNRQFKWAQARSFEATDRERAIDIYYEILSSYKELNLPNKSQEITLMHIIAQQYEKEGNRRKALEICREILNSGLSAETKEKLGKRISRIEEMERSLSGR